jgi:hypothetical protein
MTENEVKNQREGLPALQLVKPGDEKILDAKELTTRLQEQLKKSALYAPHAVAAALNDLSLTMRTTTSHSTSSGSVNPAISNDIER